MAAGVLPQIDYSRYSKNGELFLAGGVVTILFVMLVPLPTCEAFNAALRHDRAR